MTEDDHILKFFGEELTALGASAVWMGALARAQVRRAVEATVRGDLELARRVVASDADPAKNVAKRGAKIAEGVRRGGRRSRRRRVGVRRRRRLCGRDRRERVRSAARMPETT